MFREFDTSITYTRCPKGYHFIDDEGHIARNRKRERDAADDKSEAEKDAENAQAIMDDYAKDEAAVAEGVAVKRVRVENLLTLRGLRIMEQALAGLPACKELSESVDDQDSLALAWEKALLNDITHEAHDAFESAIERAERSLGACA